MFTGIDYETYYDKDCSITNGLGNYLRHKDFDAYMVSIYSADNFAWVGHPKDAPWDKLEGHIALSHNRGFDQPVHEHLIKTGVIPQTNFGEWHCTADMSAYCGYPRSLKESLKHSLGVVMSKEVRDNMKGRQFHDLGKDEKMELAQYALFDAKGCACLWEAESEKWPAWERELSQETTRMCWEGVPVDKEAMEVAINSLSRKIFDAIEILPWTAEQAGALSPKEWSAYCRSQGKEPPKSMAKDDPEVLEWIKKNPEEGAVLEATHTLRGANSLLKKFSTMVGRVENDRLAYGLKYFGAHTGRDSGDSGFNVQNMPRGGMYGADLRSCIRAGQGKTLLVSDLAQIEARCAAWLAGESDMLDLARQGMDWYEAQARSFNLYTGRGALKTQNPTLRHTMKQMSLGCQFAMSGKKFSAITGVDYDEAQTMVRMFRARMPKLVRLWGDLERDMRASAGGDYQIELPSGRQLNYRNVELEKGLSAEIPRGGRMQKLRFWKGTLIENATQAFARDVFMDRVLALRKAGHKVILRVHDEVVIEADIDNAEEAAEDINRIMSESPEWCSSLPLGTDVEQMERYTK
jgi:DNA polymerase I-like protein with 3'-5' exonuclease and polymerase domains